MMDASTPNTPGPFSLPASAVVIDGGRELRGASIADATGYVPSFVTGCMLSAAGPGARTRVDAGGALSGCGLSGRAASGRAGASSRVTSPRAAATQRALAFIFASC